MALTKENFAQLLVLQDGDSQLDSLRKSIDLVPQDIAALRAELEGEKTRLNDVQAKTKDVQLRKKSLELEMSQREEAMRKHQTELNAVKTNEAFKALLKEIEEDKAKISDLETQILVLMDEIDQTVKQEKALKKELDGMAADTERRVKDLEARKADLERQHQEAAAKRQGLAGGIPAELLEVYEATRQRRAGLAVSKVEGEACMVCHMRQTPQTVIDVKKSASIQVCGSCQRIFCAYDPAPDKKAAKAA